ncbi:MAG: sugar transferase [Lachnospiraceae bacterium]|jgi:undecaprenyl phosphate N,N'-diacetylbacillosamine 1-phosphate transferase|nr:sugar transferase [Lachnospiraceae bacterium]
MYKNFGKRLLDICISATCVPFFAIIFILVAPLIYLTDKGPIFYSAKRLGKDGIFFKMYKFRSMKVEAPDLRNADGSTFNCSNDPRVTKIGRFIRKTSIDETPQIFNVLKGDMSIIGPRAHLTTRYCGWEQQTELQKKRLSVLPGITGYSQAYFRNSASAKEKDEQDAYYVDHISLGLDMKILVQTFLSVVRHKNIYSSEGKHAIGVYSLDKEEIVAVEDAKNEK